MVIPGLRLRWAGIKICLDKQNCTDKALSLVAVVDAIQKQHRHGVIPTKFGYLDCFPMPGRVLRYLQL